MMKWTEQDVVRLFWSQFLGTKIRPDGQVPGFRRWWDGATDFARIQAFNHSFACWRKISRDRRNPEECVTASVAAFKASLAAYLPPIQQRPSFESVQRLIHTILRGIG